MRSYVPLEEAREMLMALVLPAGEETVPLLAAAGRVLAQDVAAADDIPPFDRSPLDGYALRSGDTAGASREHPVSLKVVAEIPAGRVWSGPLLPGTGAKIMTGAPIPSGADAVVRQEDTVFKHGQVQVFYPLRPMTDIVSAGEDVRAGEKVLARGTRLHAGAIGMLAATGWGQVAVYRRPRVAILCTGEELIDVSAPLCPGKIRNSNLYTLAVAVKEAGGEPVILGTAPDQVDRIAEQVTRGLAEADLVVTSGGASVGDYDLVKEAFQSVGGEVLFWRVALKPGTPVVAALAGGKLLIGLSGNPAAALITYELLARPVILSMGGRVNWARQRVIVSLDDDFHKSGGVRRFLRAVTRFEPDGFHSRLAGKQSPGVLQSILHCNSLLDIPAGCGPLRAGARLEAIMLEESEVCQ